MDRPATVSGQTTSWSGTRARRGTGSTGPSGLVPALPHLCCLGQPGLAIPVATGLPRRAQEISQAFGPRCLHSILAHNPGGAPAYRDAANHQACWGLSGNTSAGTNVVPATSLLRGTW